MDALAAPSDGDIEQAKADYRRALDVLVAHQRAVERVAKAPMVGRYFKYLERHTDDPTIRWPVFIAATGIVDEDARLIGWHFQHVPTGQMEIAPDKDLRPEFLTDACTEVTRAEFVTAFNELLTEIARRATTLP